MLQGMCNRFALPRPEEIAEHFELGALPPLLPRYNVSPGETILVVRREASQRVVDSATWGLLPRSATKPVLNLRAESLRSSAARDGTAARRARVLVPAGGFFEWRRLGRTRQPWYFQLKDSPLLALATLVEGSPALAGLPPSPRCAVLTTTPNALVASVHDRMPVILPREAYDAWLDPGVRLQELLPLLVPFPAEAMIGHPVSSAVNRPGFEDPRVIEPSQQETLF
jgi:putative SOS response-associated peptidase YedK